MIGRSEYERLTEKQVIGRKVRVLREIRNGRVIIGAGTIMRITRKMSGYSLDGLKCEHCGIAPTISKVEPFNLEWVNE